MKTLKRHAANILEVIGNSLVIAMAIISGYTFYQVKVNGVSYIYEGNDLILNIEICIVPLILAIGVINLILDIRRWRNDRSGN